LIYTFEKRSILPHKKKTLVREFEFIDQTREEFVDDLNIDYSVNCRYNENLINRIYERYPLVNKMDIAIVVQATFSLIRDLLIMGKVLNFHTLFFDTKLLFFTHTEKGVIYPAVKVQTTTPPTLKKKETNDK
jgi:hypothetical protein